MAWRIAVVCPFCKFRGSMPTDAFLLTQSVNRESNRYSWICARCKVSVVQEADFEVIAEFWKAGVSPKETRPAGPPLCEDDVIDLMLELESGSWL